MFLMFGHMSNLALKFFFGSNATRIFYFIAQIWLNRQRSEHMGKRASYAADMSPTCDIIN